MRPVLAILIAGTAAACGTRSPDVDAHRQPLPEQTPVTPSPDRFAGTLALLERAAAGGAFPGAVVSAGRGDTVLLSAAVGVYGVDDKRHVTDSTVYDLASLTKVIGLTTAVMILTAEARIDLDRGVSDYLQEFTGPGKDSVLVRHLLTHTSGLPAWRPFHLETESRDEAIDSILSASLESPPGVQYHYSDLGAISLGLIVEEVTGESLDTFLERRVFRPLGMEWTRYRPPPEWIDRIAPTEDDPWRRRVIRGEVHDENAARLGGVAGHAGLFSIAPDLSRFARWMLDSYHDRVDPSAPLYVRPEIVREFVRRQPGPEGSTRAIGWDTPSDEGSSAGTMMSHKSFGHTGFTGTSIWIDPERDSFVILLTNRVHPSRENRAVYEIRGMVSDSVAAALSTTAGPKR
jgi:CubicO group peptidase (beta-lactamase class C family)